MPLNETHGISTHTLNRYCSLTPIYPVFGSFSLSLSLSFPNLSFKAFLKSSYGKSLNSLLSQHQTAGSSLSCDCSIVFFIAAGNEDLVSREILSRMASKFVRKRFAPASELLPS